MHSLRIYMQIHTSVRSSNILDAHKVGPLLADGGAGHDDEVAAFGKAGLFGAFDGVGEQLIGVELLLGQDGIHAPGKAKLAAGFFVHTGGDDRAERAVVGQVARRAPCAGDGDDRRDVQSKAGQAGAVADGVGDVVVDVELVDDIPVPVVDRALGGAGDVGHGAQALDGIQAAGRFAREHDGRRPVVDGVGDVGDLGAGC